MAVKQPIVLGTNQHEPLAAGDTLSLPAGTIPASALSGVVAAANLPIASTTASGVIRLATSAEATAGTLTDVAVSPAALAAAVAAVAGDINVSTMAFNAVTGVLTLTETDGTVHSVTITDIQAVTATAPTATTGTSVPTDIVGGRTQILGFPAGWQLVNGLKTPYYN